MKVIAITVVLLLALIGGGVVLLGGTGIFLASKLDARSVEIEEAMMAEMERCAPKGWSKEMLDAQRAMVKKLALTAAKFEMAAAMKNGNKSAPAEDLSKLPKLPCPQNETVQVPAVRKNYESASSSTTERAKTAMDDSGWKFGDPTTVVK